MKSIVTAATPGITAGEPVADEKRGVLTPLVAAMSHTATPNSFEQACATRAAAAAARGAARRRSGISGSHTHPR